MATINSTIQDANGKTIDDYKAAYAAAKAAGDAAGMQAANNAANAIRAGQGVAAENAGVSIANTAAKAASSGGYTPLNATSAEMINYDNYLAQVRAQNAYIAANPTATTPLSAEEYRINTSDAGTHGWTTTSLEELNQAMRQGYKAEQRTDENGQKVYYISDVTRTEQEGTSGADEALLSDSGYTYIQYLKADYAEAQKNYNNAVAAYEAALAAGNAQLAEQYKAGVEKYKAQMEQDHLEAERVRAGANYSGGADGSMYIDYTMQAAAGNMPAYTTAAQNLLDAKGISYTLPDGTVVYPNSGTGGTGGSVPGMGGSTGVPSTDSAKADLLGLLEQWKASAEEQGNLQVDFAVQQAITELERALEDAQPQFKEQQESITKDEMQALDNSALYAEARGDKGGIGQEQYNSIQNTAAQNRLAVHQAQTKLSTDTQRQIADLRAQGEFEKADNLLEISQNYLAQLISLEQWAAEYNLSVAQFEESIRQWQASFEESIRQFDLSFDYQQYRDNVSDSQWQQQFDYNAAQDLYAQNYNQQSTLAQQGLAMVQNGLTPSSLQLAAMKDVYGYDESAVNSLISAAQLAAKTDPVYTGSPGNPVEDMSRSELYQHLFDEGYTTRSEASIKAYLMGEGMSATEATAVADAYVNEQYKTLKEQEYEGAPETGMNEAYFRQAMSSLATSLAQKLPTYTDEQMISYIKQTFDPLWGRLSKAQREQANAMLAAYGYAYSA